jgi:hypothetical protein
MDLVAAVVALALIAVVVAFQFGLAGGAPWGAASWGGAVEGVLPARLRIASAMSVLVLGFMGWAVAARAGLIDLSPVPRSVLGGVAWGVSAYFGLGAVVNLASRSKVERLWSPVSAVIAVCAGIVAAS